MYHKMFSDHNTKFQSVPNRNSKVPESVLSKQRAVNSGLAL
jgi:hypothetical protein